MKMYENITFRKKFKVIIIRLDIYETYSRLVSNFKDLSLDI